MDPCTRLNCCNLDIHWWKWWLQSWSVVGGEAHKTQSWVCWYSFRLTWEHPGDVATLWIICSPQRWKDSEQSLGAYNPFKDMTLSHISPVELSQSCLIRRDEHFQACVCVPKISPGAGEFYNRASWVREDTGMMESTISPPQCLLLIILLPCLAQTPACSKTKVDLSWSSSGDHPLCTWSALLHTVSKAPAGFANGWLLTIIISVSQPHNRLLPACAQFFLQKLGAALSTVPK